MPGPGGRGSILLTTVVTLLTTQDSCAAFQAAFIRYEHALPPRYFSHNDAFTRLFSTGNGNKDEAYVDGKELAEQFYDQLKRRASTAREGELIGTSLDDKRVPIPLSQSPSPEASPETVLNEKDSLTIDIDKNIQLTRRFTRGSPSFSDERSSSNLQREREREFNLAGNFERTIGIQAVILIASLLFVTLIGFTGGITDGSDRNFGGVDDLGDTMIEGFRTDDATEVETQTDDIAEASVRGSTKKSVWL